jgi:hypothetical protein
MSINGTCYKLYLLGKLSAVYIRIRPHEIYINTLVKAKIIL